MFRPATFIEDATDNITLALIIARRCSRCRSRSCSSGAPCSIALITIPVSLMAAALVLDVLGETFNAISFAGLAVALAVVIDEAVVGAENVARRLREQARRRRASSVAHVVEASPRCAARWPTRR